jgi:tetratricopeptide (TPR) repeat protein
MIENTSPHRERGWMLAAQGRTELAEREYRMALSDDPHDATAHALLALLLSDQPQRHADALAEARTAVGLDPENAFVHYAEARVHLEAERWDDAERAALTCIRVDPDAPDGYNALAWAHLGRKRWSDALGAADEALELDPDDGTALNLRAMALVQLGRKDEAAATLHGALAQDPENSATHANQGWALLHRGDRKRALESFREALRLDPENEWAREGLVEALKAGNPVYAAMLRYFLWMQRLDRRTQWIVILGGYFGYRALRSAANSNPALAPWVTPLIVAYVVFVLLSWTAPQLFNAVLLASRDGRYALSDEQRLSGRFMAGGVGAALALGAAALLTGGDWALNGAVLSAVLLIPLSAVFRGPRGVPTRGLAINAGVLYALAALSVALAAAGVLGASGLLFMGVLLGAVATSWIVNLRGR